MVDDPEEEGRHGYGSISGRSTSAPSTSWESNARRRPNSIAREKNRKKLDIVELSPQARDEHAATWQKVQAEFVDAPSDAVGRAERLVTRVMRERGYPIDDFDQRASDISVDHPDIVENYRSAHLIYQSQHDGQIETEAARQAFVHYRALFDRLLGAEHREQEHQRRTQEAGT